MCTGVEIAGLALAGIGTATSTVGAIKTAEANKNAASYNSSVAANNAAIAKQNAIYASQAGEEQAAMQERKTRAGVASIEANQAASGVDVNTGSAVDVRSSAAEMGELDAISVRSNAARTAYGYTQQAQSYEDQSKMYNAMASNAETEGYLSASSTFLSGLGSTALNYSSYASKNGLKTES